MLVSALIALWILGLSVWVLLKLRQPHLRCPKPPETRNADVAVRDRVLDDHAAA